MSDPVKDVIIQIIEKADHNKVNQVMAKLVTLLREDSECQELNLATQMFIAYNFSRSILYLVSDTMALHGAQQEEINTASAAFMHMMLSCLTDNQYRYDPLDAPEFEMLIKRPMTQKGGIVH